MCKKKLRWEVIKFNRRCAPEAIPIRVSVHVEPGHNQGEGEEEDHEDEAESGVHGGVTIITDQACILSPGDSETCCHQHIYDRTWELESDR